jgi:hypothetical protein
VTTDVHPELKYTFKSEHLGVEVQLSEKLLRPRYDWVYGPWKQESEVCTNFRRIYISFKYLLNSNLVPLVFTVCFLYVLKLQDRLQAHNADDVLLCFIPYNLVMYLTKLFFCACFLECIKRKIYTMLVLFFYCVLSVDQSYGRTFLLGWVI